MFMGTGGVRERLRQHRGGEHQQGIGHFHTYGLWKVRPSYAVSRPRPTTIPGANALRIPAGAGQHGYGLPVHAEGVVRIGDAAIDAMALGVPRAGRLRVDAAGPGRDRIGWRCRGITHRPSAQGRHRRRPWPAPCRRPASDPRRPQMPDRPGSRHRPRDRHRAEAHDPRPAHGSRRAYRQPAGQQAPAGAGANIGRIERRIFILRGVLNRGHPTRSSRTWRRCALNATLLH